jgi:hypothetical protein
MTQKSKAPQWSITRAQVAGREAILQLKSIGPAPVIAFDRSAPEFSRALTAFGQSNAVEKYRSLHASLTEALVERDQAARGVIDAEQVVSDGSDTSGRELASAMERHRVAERRVTILQESVRHSWQQLQLEFSQLSDRTSNEVNSSVQTAINERHAEIADAIGLILSELRVLHDRRDRGAKHRMDFSALGLSAPPAVQPVRMSEGELVNG